MLIIVLPSFWELFSNNYSENSGLEIVRRIQSTNKIVIPASRRLLGRHNVSEMQDTFYFDRRLNFKFRIFPLTDQSQGSASVIGHQPRFLSWV